MHLAVPALATLGTGPLIAHYFGHLSLAGFVANPLIVPLVGFVVVPLGLGIGFLSVIAPELGLFVVWCCGETVVPHRLDGRYLRALAAGQFCRAFAECLGSRALYGLLLFGTFALRKRIHLRRAVCARADRCSERAAPIGGASAMQRQELRVTHLNVGQGDAAVVELPGSKVFLIDAGGTASGGFRYGGRHRCAFSAFAEDSQSRLSCGQPSANRPLRRHAHDRQRIRAERILVRRGQRPNPPLRGSGGDAGKIARSRALLCTTAKHAELSSRSGFALFIRRRSKPREGSVVVRLEYGKFAPFIRQRYR